jgi:hypothetical protein
MRSSLLGYKSYQTFGLYPFNGLCICSMHMSLRKLNGVAFNTRNYAMSCVLFIYLCAHVLSHRDIG